MKDELLFKEKNLGKLIAKYIIPAMIAMTINSLYDVVDRLFISLGAGVDALSGVSVCSPIITIITGCSIITASGASILIPIKLGEKKLDKVEEVLGNSVTISVIIGVVATVALQLLLQPMLVYLGADDEIITYSLQYMRIFIISIVFQNIGFVLNYSMRAIGKPMISLLTMIIGAGINLVLNPLFIFVLHLGVRGSAISTLISQIISTIWCISYFNRKGSTVRLKLKCMKVLDNTVNILKSGCPIFIFQILVSVTLSIANNICQEYGGNTGLAVISIVASVYTLFQMMSAGIAQGITPILGFEFGAKHKERIVKTMKISITLATVLCTLGFVFVFGFGDKLMAIALDSSENVEVGTNALKYVCCMLPIVGFQLIMSTYYQVIDKFQISVLINLLRQAVINIPAFLILPKYFGLMGCFLVFPLTDIIVFVVILGIMGMYLMKNKVEVSDVSRS